MINSFPGYEYVKFGENGKPQNMYRGIDLGFGGYVYAEPGMYSNVALLDVQSMHPTSIINMECFGEYTKRYKDIYDARVAIKHHDYETAGQLMDGLLKPYLTSEEQADQLATALKLCLNGTYGLTSASFNNPFRDPRNVNNIVALRGALFMKTLQDEVQSRGFVVNHIKTDSIKVPNATKEIIDFIMEFGKQYGYVFEHEATYEKMCLVNDAVYIAKYKDGKHAGEWTATGAQFAVPYVFKTLFSKDPIKFDDLCETLSVKTALYLDMNEELPDVTMYEAVKDLRRKNKEKPTKKERSMIELCFNLSDEELEAEIAKGHDRRFIGKVSQFCPIKPGCGGGILLRQGEDANGNTTYSSATGAKGYRWLESELLRSSGNTDIIDKSYYSKLVDEAVETISKYGDFEWFVSDDDVVPLVYQEAPELPWLVACGKETCTGCKHFHRNGSDMSCSAGYDIRELIIAADMENESFNKR